MHKIQELFDPSKQLNRKIESVVTFGANTTEDLDHEIREVCRYGQTAQEL